MPNLEVNPASCVINLSAVDTVVKDMELQVQSIKDRLREEAFAIPKAKRLIEASLQQQKSLQEVSAHVRSHFPEKTMFLLSDPRYLVDNFLQRICFSFCTSSMAEVSKDHTDSRSARTEEGHPPPTMPKEKKGRGSPPLWYISADELDSLSSYMKGRLTLEKLPERMWEKALELRDIATTEAVRGKHFFLETDIRGPSLKLDNTGKATLTIHSWILGHAGPSSSGAYQRDSCGTSPRYYSLQTSLRGMTTQTVLLLLKQTCAYTK